MRSPSALGCSSDPVLAPFDSPTVQEFNDLFDDLWTIAIIGLLLTFVSGGRLESTADRVLVGAMAVQTILQFVRELFLAHDGNFLLVHPDRAVAGALETANGLIVTFAAVGTVVVIGVRFTRASAPRRRAMLPSVAGAALLVVALATVLAWVLLVWLVLAALLLVPAAFLAGLLRSRLARGGLRALFGELGGMRGEALQARWPGRSATRPSSWPTRGAGRDTPTRTARGFWCRPAPAARSRRIDGGGDRLRRVARRRPRDGRGGRRGPRSPSRTSGSLTTSQSVAPADRRRRRRRAPQARARPARRRPAAARRALAAAADAPGRHPARPGRRRSAATDASDELAHSLEELRELARGIHPATLDHGLSSALESLAARSTVATAVSCEAPAHVPRDVELALYFVACEALANVGKYAGATAASVRLSRTATGVAIEIADDGVGGADAANGSGLRGLADRVEALDGQLRVTSPPGAGTVVIAELPCAS